MSKNSSAINNETNLPGGGNSIVDRESAIDAISSILYNSLDFDFDPPPGNCSTQIAILDAVLPHVNPIVSLSFALERDIALKAILAELIAATPDDDEKQIAEAIFNAISECVKPAPAPKESGIEQHPILNEIMAEVKRACNKFPTWPTDALHAVGVVAEEMGELQKEVMQLTYDSHKSTPETVRKEAVQLAAISLRFLISLDRYTYVPGMQHSQSTTLDTKLDLINTSSVKKGEIKQIDIDREAAIQSGIKFLKELKLNKPEHFYRDIAIQFMNTILAHVYSELEDPPTMDYDAALKVIKDALDEAMSSGEANGAAQENGATPVWFAPDAEVVLDAVLNCIELNTPKNKE